MTSHTSRTRTRTRRRGRTRRRNRIRHTAWQATAPVDAAGSSLTSSALALLIGTVLGWLVAALGGPVERVFNPPSAHGVITAAMLLCVAIGTRLPHRIARWLALLTWNRRRNQRTGDSTDSPSTDIQLLMMVLGAVAMLTGLAIAASPLLVRLAGWSYRIVVDRFFWMSCTYALLVAAITCLATIAPLALTGFFLTCVNQLGRLDQKSPLATLPWVLLGCGTGIALFSTTGTFTVKWELLVIVAAVPVLVVAIGAVRCSKRPAPTNVAPPPSPSPPGRGSTNSVFTRVVGIVVTAAASCLMILWYRCMLDGARSPLGSAELPVVLLWAAALGTGWGSGAILNTAGRRPGFGLSCVAAACINFATVILIASIDRLSGPSAVIVATALPCVAVSAAAVAVARLRDTILAESTHRNATESLLLSETFWIPACVIIVLAIVAPNLDQLYRAITVIAVGLSAVGLLVILQKPPHRSTHRNVQLAAAVGSLALMVLLWPNTARRWRNSSIDMPSPSTLRTDPLRRHAESSRGYPPRADSAATRRPTTTMVGTPPATAHSNAAPISPRLLIRTTSSRRSP